MSIVYFVLLYLSCSNYNLLYTRCHKSENYKRAKNEQIKKELDLVIREIIYKDKINKIKKMMKKGLIEEEANKKIELLKSLYKKEKNKFLKTARIRTREREDKQAKCEGLWKLIFENPKTKLRAIETTYIFDKDSKDFFDLVDVQGYNHPHYLKILDDKVVGVISNATYINCNLKANNGFGAREMVFMRDLKDQ